MFDGAGSLADWAQVIIAAIGIAGLIFTLRQNTEALRATHKDFIASNPPLLRIGTIEAIPPEIPGDIAIQLRITNEGSSSAWITEGIVFPLISEDDLDYEPNFEAFTRQEPLHPGVTRVYPMQIQPKNGLTAADFENGTVPLYLKGAFYYEDSIGIKRYLQIYREYDRTRGRFRPFPQGHHYAGDKPAY